MPLGITRSRMHQLLKTKGKKKLTKKRFSKASLNKTYDEQQLIKSNLLSTKSSEVEMSQFEQPSWIDDYKDCCFILRQVEVCRDQIKRQNAKKLMSAKPEAHDRRISSLAEQATGKLRKCQKKLKNIQLANNSESNPQQRKIFTNIIVSLAQKIRHSAKSLRSDRQQQLSHQKQIQKYNMTEFQKDMRRTEETQDSSWLSQEGLQVLEHRLQTQRNEQIMKIVKSIHSLNSIYKQLGDLVIHQGSLLDRIDQNINTTYDTIVKANEHLKQAQEHQKSPCAKKVIYVLAFLIIIFFTIFMLRHS